jgi:hypothetical protein
MGEKKKNCAENNKYSEKHSYKIREIKEIEKCKSGEGDRGNAKSREYEFPPKR